MQHVLVTGATGLIGFHITQALLRQGIRPRLMVRDLGRAKALHGEGADLIEGDLTKPKLWAPSTFEGVDVLFHAAGVPEQWLPDPGVFDAVNRQGCIDIATAARDAGVRRFVFLSTIDVFEPDAKGRIHEGCARRTQSRSPYESSKQAADAWLFDRTNIGPMETVFLHPCATYGPGPTRSRGTNDFVRELREGKIPILVPGGVPLVLAADVGEAAVRAAEKGRAGERFVLTSQWLTLRDLAVKVHQQLGYGRVPPVLPLPVARAVSWLTERASALFGGAPLVPKGQLDALQWGAVPDASHALARLGMAFTSVDQGLANLLGTSAPGQDAGLRPPQR